MGHLRCVTTPAEGEWQDPLERLQAYRLAREAMRDARDDLLSERKVDQALREVVGQLLRAVASIAANIAEGYSRGTSADRRRFFEYALGSTRECLVWYDALPPESFPASRIDRLISIRRLLLTMIRNSRATTAADHARFAK
jgi:four helix bundle protein